ncbi:MAG: glycosyltransferase [Bifidobacteriaceae bacterium]|jgi:galactofuranosylgalactofuranosylrhamnosyl-N-acetylglucosaminyl-diphospho-decaprenol beta-1,5/1,6-galactofuranosyltransferase|nr:glycosyltransferase [Bifidobacteriaceae bacterium]
MSQTTNSWETVNRVVYPVRDASLTAPLYVIKWTRPLISEAVFNTSERRATLDFSHINSAQFERLVRQGAAKAAAMNVSGSDAPFTIDSRDALTVLSRGHVSLCTFFNAFPAGYWRRWTKVREVRFEARVKGTGTLTLFRSTGRGLFTPVTSLEINAPNRARTVSAQVPLVNMMDGGYVWFDASAGQGADDALTVSQAHWQVPSELSTATPRGTSADGDAKQRTSLSVAITTFNRPTYCRDQLRALSEATELRERLDTIYCTDQGTDLVSSQPDFEAIAKDLGDQLRYIRQRNLGGSGGFSRGMYETVKAGRSDYTLVLDDDAISEPEAILRAMQFADYTTRPTIVGGGMLHLDNRTILYSQGERMNMNSMWMRPSQGLKYNHDFAAEPLRDSPERHRRIDEDFNGWWMCLIPTAIIEEIGLSLPIFIKFDDMEYSLRAKEHGYPTVGLPGVAVWHQAWHDKDPARTWEEYFFQRNRWICALLHCPHPTKRFLFEMMYGDLNVGMRLVYSALELRHMGLRDILRGPEEIVASMPTKLAEVRTVRGAFDDAQSSDSLDDFPEPASDVPGIAARSKLSLTARGVADAVSALTAHGRRGSGVDDERPATTIPATEELWESFHGVSSALVTSPDGSSAAWLKRDSDRFRAMMKEGGTLAHHVYREWERLSAEYRAADMASMETWEKLFKES